MADLKVSEIQALVKDKMVEIVTASLPNPIQTGSATYVVPFEVGDETVYGEVAISVKRFRNTEKVSAFNLDEAVGMYEAKLLEAEEKAKAKAAEKAEKEAAKAAKAD